MEPYWMFLKTVVNTMVSLMGAAAVLFTSGPAPEVPEPRAATVLRASLGHWTDAAAPDPAQESADRTTTIVIEALVGALKDTDAGVRRHAAIALGEIGDSSALEPLTRAMKDEDPEVRRRAIAAIAELSGGDGHSQGWGRPRPNPNPNPNPKPESPVAAGGGVMMTSEARYHRPGARVLSIVAAIVMAASGAFAQDVSAMSARLKANDPSERARAACEIKKLGTDARGLIPQLVSMLGDAAAVPGDVCGDWGRWWKGGEHGAQIPETTPGERAAQALVAIGSASFDPIVQALRGPQWHARKNAAWALGALDDRRAVEPLASALKDTEPPVRRSAAWALGAIDDERGVAALIEALKDSDAETRAQAVWALGAIDDERAVPGLVGALSDDNSKVRAQAAWALGAIGDRRAAAALAAAMKDPDAKVRRQAAWALGAIQ